MSTTMEWWATYFSGKIAESSDMLQQLAFVLVAATAFIMIQRGIRRTRIRTVVRALLAKRIWMSRSAMLDYQYVALNLFLFPIMIGGVILGTNEFANLVGSYTSPVAHESAYLSPTQSRVMLTVVLFLALEFAYWLDHYLSHRVPLLWAFHKVHHTAEVLTPLTNLRVHPVDTLFFYNIKSIIIGLVYGVAIFAMDTGPMAMPEGTIIVIYMWLYGHLQHSHLWIAFPGWIGKIFFSPAHHQIHHSKAPIHHNTNFGMSLSIFDWMFGTLHLPTREKQNLNFGIAHDPHDHKLGASLIEPLVFVWKRFTKPKKRKAPVAAAPVGPEPALARTEIEPAPSYV